MQWLANGRAVKGCLVGGRGQQAVHEESGDRRATKVVRETMPNDHQCHYCCSCHETQHRQISENGCLCHPVAELVAVAIGGMGAQGRAPGPRDSREGCPQG